MIRPRGALKCTEKVDSAVTLQSTNSTVEIYVLMFKLFFVNHFLEVSPIIFSGTSDQCTMGLSTDHSIKVF